MAILIPCLVTLFDEFDDIAPDRDHSTDGWIGDTSHASGSDHNPDESGNTPHEDSDNIDEVHAIDVDKDLNEDGEPSMEDCVQHILSRCRNGDENRLHYIIYNKRIWSESDDWRQETYTGSNPHDKHAHFSACYETARESDTSPWMEGLMGLSSDDKKYIDTTIAKYVGDVVNRWNSDGSQVPANDPNPQMTLSSAMYYAGADGAHSRYVQLKHIEDKLDDLAAQVARLTAGG